MPTFTQRSFAAGEITPALRARADLSKYTTGLARCENFIIRSTGGVYNRPGTQFVGQINDSTKRARLIPFAFNTQQTYVLVFEENRIYVVKDGDFLSAVYDPLGTPLAYIPTTYTEAQIPFIGFTQDADVMTLVHPDHAPKTLSRVAEDDWRFASVDFNPSISAPTMGAITQVGTASGSPNKNYRYVVTAVNTDGVESLPSAEGASGAVNALSTTYGNRISWSAPTGTIDYYRVYKDPSDGSGLYGWIGDSNGSVTTFDDYNIQPTVNDAPPKANLPFNSASNYPAAVGYYQQRQIYANTDNKPSTVFASQIAIYNSMRSSVPTKDDDAITLTIKASQVNEIRHIISLDALFLLTSGGEWLLSEGQDQVFTPFTVGVRAKSYNGASWVRPAIVNSTAIYVQDKGTRIRELTHNSQVDGYRNADLSILANHLFDGYQIEEMAYAAEPYGILWCVRDDGALLGMTYEKDNDVWAWHQHTTNGWFESVAVISEGSRDSLYVIVQRIVNGSYVRYVERLAPRYSDFVEDSFYVDSGLSFDGTNITATTMTVTSGSTYTPGVDLTITASVGTFAVGDIGDSIVLTGADGLSYRLMITAYSSTTSVTARVLVDLPADLQNTATVIWAFARNTFSGLSHLEGEAVAVLADGNVVAGLSVSGGAVEIPRPAVKVHIGLAYTSTIETLDIDTTAVAEQFRDRKASVNKVLIEFYQSRGGWVGGRNQTEAQMLELKPRFDADGYDAIQLKDDKREINIAPGWQEGGAIRIQQRSPLPMTIVALVPRVDFSK